MSEPAKPGCSLNLRRVDLDKELEVMSNPLQFLKNEFRRDNSLPIPKIYVLPIVLGGIGAILIGLPYLNSAFWYKETDPAVAGAVAYWGDLSYQIGIVLLIFSGTLFIRNTKLQRVVISSMLATTFLMQIPPILS